jgi:hypothetical protein
MLVPRDTDDEVTILVVLDNASTLIDAALALLPVFAIVTLAPRFAVACVAMSA